MIYIVIRLSAGFLIGGNLGTIALVFQVEKPDDILMCVGLLYPKKTLVGPCDQVLEDCLSILGINKERYFEGM